MGIDFEFDCEGMCYKLVVPQLNVVEEFCDETCKTNVFERTVERVYDALELICIGRSILRSLHSINEKGFVSEDCLLDTFIIEIMRQLYSSNYNFSFSVFGTSELTYTMWYN
jgi:hypothetical protein